MKETKGGGGGGGGGRRDRQAGKQTQTNREWHKEKLEIDMEKDRDRETDRETDRAQYNIDLEYSVITCVQRVLPDAETRASPVTPFSILLASSAGTVTPVPSKTKTIPGQSEPKCAAYTIY